MNLRDLEYLVAVEQERHFNKAAKRCFVSQPTLSGQLKKLEDELGVLLIERNTRQVVMTDVGLAIATQARLVLAEAKSIKVIAQTFHDPMAGELHIGLIPTLAPYLLPLIMPALKTHCPKLKLWLYEHQTAVLLTKLSRAEIDLLILALPVNSDEYSEIDLFNEPFWLAVPSSDRLASHNRLTLADLNGLNMMLLEEGHCLRGQALDICFNTGAHEQSGFQATSLETLRHMVGEGMGMTLLPALSVPKKVTIDDAIRYLPFVDPQPTRRIGMLYRKGSYRASAFERIAEVIRATVQ